MQRARQECHLITSSSAPKSIVCKAVTAIRRLRTIHTNIVTGGEIEKNQAQASFESAECPLAEQDANMTRYQTPNSENLSRVEQPAPSMAVSNPSHPNRRAKKFEICIGKMIAWRGHHAEEKIRSGVFGIDGLAIWPLYRTRHFLSLLRLVRDRRAARVACSNTSRTPSLVLAEHSRYL